ncbi:MULTISPECIES: hypothetical protein [Polymorphospora]|uniref:Uncharacterized protein n=1 Tax=Polymorphospora lycopeni TaxID=3140240 RepID=A0ABV5CYW9_9ACTN
MRVRTMVRTTAVLLVAFGVAAVLGFTQAQEAWNLAGYTWSN